MAANPTTGGKSKGVVGFFLEGAIELLSPKSPEVSDVRQGRGCSNTCKAGGQPTQLGKRHCVCSGVGKTNTSRHLLPRTSTWFYVTKEGMWVNLTAWFQLSYLAYRRRARPSIPQSQRSNDQARTRRCNCQFREHEHLWTAPSFLAARSDFVHASYMCSFLF